MVAPLVIGAALGLAKSAADADKEKRERALQAQLTRYSPWTKMGGHPEAIQQADPLGNVATGALSAQMMASANPGLFGGGTAAATDAATAGPGAANGTTGAVPPMGQSAPYAGTPAGAAAQQGQFPQYFQQAYASPWSQMR